MKDTSSFLDLALDDSMGFDPLGAFDDDVEEDAEEVTGGYLGTPHTDVPAPVVDTRPAPERIAYPEGDPEPVLVEVDGVSYYEAGEAPEVCWLATEDGAAYAEADKPLDRLTNLLAEDAKYATIYERILGLTAQESGASMPTINEAVDNDELLKSPRLYAPHFIDKLEKCDAVEWRDKSWRITEVGRAGQRIVADLVAAQAAPEPEAQADKGAETGETTADAQ